MEKSVQATHLAPALGQGNRTTETETIPLPVELQIKILSQLEPSDVAWCRLACKQFDKLVTEQLRLKYPLQLGRANCVDGPENNTLSLLYRSQALKDYQHSWDALKFHRLMSVSYGNSPEVPRLWVLRGGVLLVGLFDEFVAARMGGAEIPGFNVIEIHFLHCQDENLRMSCYQLDDYYTDAIVDPAQDLIILWNCDRSEDDASIALISLSDGTSTSQGSDAPTQLFPGVELDSEAVQLQGHTLSVRPCASVTTFIRDLSSGKMAELHTPRHRGCLLSASCFIVGSCALSVPSIDVYTIARDDSQQLVLTLITKFELPHLRKQGDECCISIRAFSSYDYRSVQPTARLPAPPFSRGPDPVMVLCTIDLLGYEILGTYYKILMYTAPFQNAVKQRELGPEARLDRVPWRGWGPHNTFWFERGFTNYAEYMWIQSLYGYRVLLPGTLLDFNPRTVDQKAESGEARETVTAVKVHEGTSVEGFGEPVKTDARYREYTLPLMQEFQYYMLEEEIVGISVRVI